MRINSYYVLTSFNNFRLDPSLIRPGRVDMEQKIDFCSDYQLVELFKR